MIVYAVDQAVKDLKDLLKCSWLVCRKLLHFAMVDDTLDCCEYNNNVQIEIVKLECLLEG